MDHQRIGTQITAVDLVIEILADFVVGNLFRRLVVMCNEIEHGVQVVFLRGLRQAVVLHVGHKALTQRCAAALQNFGTFALLRSIRHIVSLPPVRFRLRDFRISGMRLVLNGFLRIISTLFGFLTIVRYGMGVLITHVCCLSRSIVHSGWVDYCRMLGSAAKRSHKFYKISQNPGIVKTRARRFSLISIVVGRFQSVRILGQACGFHTDSHSTFETLKILAA